MDMCQWRSYDEKIIGTFYEKELQKINEKEFNVSNLIKKTDYNTKSNEIEKKITDHSHDKYITTSEFTKPTAENFVARLAQANLVTNADSDNKPLNLNKI